MRWSALLLLALLLFVVSTQARADAGSVPSSPVRLRIVARSGFTFTVDAVNPSDAPVPFDSVGLYFVPQPEPGETAQRLGVVSAPRVMTAGAESGGAVTIAPRQTVRLVLTAYCLDEHRSAPTPKTTYHLANRRIPTALSDALASAVQSAVHDRRDPERAVWAVRAQMPVTLVGELPSAPRTPHAPPITNR